MILKLRMQVNQTDKEEVAWRILDNIKRIDYKYVDEPTNCNEAGITYINTYPEVLNKRVTELDVLYKNGYLETMYTDDVVFVLNDNGKTCDTINT